MREESDKNGGELRREGDATGRGTRKKQDGDDDLRSRRRLDRFRDEGGMAMR